MNAKQAAAKLRRQHGLYSAGFYSDRFPRCFQAKAKRGVLLIFDWDRWYSVNEKTVFRDHNGRELFTYDPGEN